MNASVIILPFGDKKSVYSDTRSFPSSYFMIIVTFRWLTVHPLALYRLARQQVHIIRGQSLQ